MLSGDEAKVLIELWLTAGRDSKDGVIKLDSDLLAWRLRRDAKIMTAHLNSLQNKGFISLASNALASCKQSAMPETEGETEGEAKTETHIEGVSPHSPVSESTLTEYQGAVSFLKLHPAFEKIQPMAIENTLKGFAAYKQHWPKMLREFQSDNAGVDVLKYPPCQALRIAFSRYVKFNNLPSPYQSN